MAERRLRHVHELDGLRGLLALWVVVSHVVCLSGFSELVGPGHGQATWRDFAWAQPAVKTFMILSGFAIAFLLNERRPSYLRFLRGRVFRIYPVYLVCLALGVAATIQLDPTLRRALPWAETPYFEPVWATSEAARAHLWPHLLAHLSMLFGMIPHRVLPYASGAFLPPGWSITLEWQFYLVAPLVLRMTRSGAGLLLMVLAARFSIGYAYAWSNWQLAFLPPMLPLFLVGVGSYHLHARRADSEGPGTIWPAALLLAFVWLVNWHDTAMTVWALSFGSVFVGPRPTDLLGRALGVVRRTLASRGLGRLGAISYPLYLVHWPILVAVLTALATLRPGLSRLESLAVLLALGLPLSLLAAAVLHRYVEAPAMALGKRPRLPLAESAATPLSGP